MKSKTTDQELGLLQAIDERLAMYGWITNTGTKFVIIVDMEGRPPAATDSNISTLTGLKDSDLKPVSVTLHSPFLFKCTTSLVISDVAGRLSEPFNQHILGC